MKHHMPPTMLKFTPQYNDRMSIYVVIAKLCFNFVTFDNCGFISAALWVNVKRTLITILLVEQLHS